ncbi:MAG: hypothetical protein FWD17_07655 [Polyangiaceae bacterium]|nr:hypothetical protein [Polyangiaceae bacterium]
MTGAWRSPRVRAVVLVWLCSLASLRSALWAAAGCAPHPVDAVILGTELDAGDGGVDNAGAEGGTSADASPPTLIWPNAVSHTNSDAWIAAHHDQIAQMQPQVLVLDFANRFQPEMGSVVQAGYDIQQTLGPIVQQHIDAFAVASRYQGYKNANAPAFLQYQIKKVVDLRDSTSAVNSGQLPVTNGSVDYAQLATQTFGDLIGIEDPDNAGTNLTLCGLFEKGIIHEVWAVTADPLLATDPPTVRFAQVAETKQVYDATNVAVAGQLACTSSPCIAQALPCSVTTRIYDFNPGRGAGCQLFVNGLVWQQYLRAGVLPAFAKAGRTFFDFDFDTRFNAPFPSFYSVCPAPTPDGGACITWPSETRAVSGPAASIAFDFSPMSAGCGNVVFPPNATGESVQEGDITVLTSCENYGLRNAASGADVTTPYSNAIAASDYMGVAGVATDCGGAQPTYILASMPGLGTSATAADGTPMKNWWVYLFY